MATKTQRKLKAGSKLVFLPLEGKMKKRKLELSNKHDFKAWGDMLAEAGHELPKAIVPYLTLHAGNTKVNNKGWLNAINCRNMFAEGPNIDFIPPDNSFGGKIEVWMENVTQGDSFTIQFRVTCGSAGNWKIASSETAQFQTPIGPVMQSIDFYIPPVTSDYGLVLITLEPIFTNSGFWVFHDAIVNKLNY